MILPAPSPPTLDDMMQDLGWKKAENGYRGQVATPQKVYYTYLVTLDGVNYKFLIKNPSQNIINGGCVFLHQGEWRWLHFHTGSNNPIGQIAKANEHLKRVDA